jgi:L-ascorbate metabolism protein UlaG (beta-lactamase superfamily)
MNARSSIAFAFILYAALSATGLVVAGASCRPVYPAPIVASEEMLEELPQNSALEIRYIANEGVLLTSRDKRVLIDGLHRKYEDDYAYLPDAEREKIEAAGAPFDKIDLILVSHRHGDHFHPESVGLHLRNNPKTLFASSRQVVDEMAASFPGYASIKDRVTPIMYSLKSRQAMKLAGIDVEFLCVGHGSGRHAVIQNLGHVINIGGKKVLHVGDAEITPEIFETKGIDIAILPYWFLTSKTGPELIDRHIKPKQLIAVHIGPVEGDQVRLDVKKNFPKADVFTTMLERRNF